MQEISNKYVTIGEFVKNFSVVFLMVFREKMTIRARFLTIRATAIDFFWGCANVKVC